MTILTAPRVIEQPDDWTEPGAWPVVPGVHRIPLPLPMDGLRAVNVYVLTGDDGLTLIDGGWAIPEARHRLAAGLQALGAEVGDIRRFLVTHVHRDHYTQAVAVRREVGAHVSLGVGDRATLDIIANVDRIEGDPNVERLTRAGAHALVRGWQAMLPGKPDVDDYEPPDTWLERDLVLDVGGRSLQAIATPGHTAGHYVFADEAAGVLFAGDHVLPTITPSIGFEPAWVDQPLADFLASLAKVRAMPDRLLLPAHGPVTTSVHARVDELVAHHDDRLARCLDAVASGHHTAYDVARQLGWTRRERRFDDLHVFDAVLATFETLAHLALLTARGVLTREDIEGVARFWTTPSDA